MTSLNSLTLGARVRGILADQTVTLIAVTPRGTTAVEVVYRRADGGLGQQLLYDTDADALTVVTDQPRWAFDGDGARLRLISEAYRIRLAHLFDPVLAVHTSLIDPLPHQITAVYHEMLTRQPLRYLLADDPGAGKTIMAGLLIRELVVRGDVRRCLICAPGSLTEQWQDELWTKFQLDFTILTREMVETARSGNPFAERDLIIVRLDQLSRSDELQARLQQTDWDLIVCDEAHKMAASFFGGELKETRRYKLGRLLGAVSRHFLLMSATPHNGKEEDFQLFLALLDADRFEGRFRDGVHRVDVSDLMRRMVKESLRKFDGTPLFPERRAYTLNYALSPDEAALYDAVTEYVRDEFNRAEALENDGRKGTVGFALTILQRRLASSPEAIWQSLKRRRERLEKRLKESRAARQMVLNIENADVDADDETWEDFDDALSSELERIEAELVDSATAARTLAELELEIASLRHLETLALRLRQSGSDRKWSELANLLHDTPEMYSATGARRKLVIFTEHRDTLNYLDERLKTLMGQPDAVVCIHGGMGRDERRGVEAAFRNDPDVHILLATDAAGEGINLQRAHLMVNYDLPWNPNRLEQRFGRIHRIGQTEVCHLWNLVAGETREGAVYQRLLRKLEAERGALDGQVFDVLGKLFQEMPLRRLLVEAVRYGDDPDVRARLNEAVDNAVDRDRARDLWEQGALAETRMDTSQIASIRADMERASARRLQPHYIRSFFVGAFEALGGTLHERENGRYQINTVPAAIRAWAKDHGIGAVAAKYERICFEKGLIQQPDGRGTMHRAPTATFVCPGHALLDATLGLLLEREGGILERGALLIDPADPGTVPRVLFYLDHAVQDALTPAGGERRTISREVHFVEIDSDGNVREAGGAPYLDYRAATPDEIIAIEQGIAPTTALTGIGAQMEMRALDYAIESLVPRHLEQVRARRIALIDKTEAAVQERLTKEINYWDARAAELKHAEQSGRVNARLNSQRAQERADRLHERLKQRKAQLAQERQISAAPPVIVGGALIIPIGLLIRQGLTHQGLAHQGLMHQTPTQDLLDRRITEQIAMRAVIDAEIALGNTPRDVSAGNVGYDIESRDGRTGTLRFIEVKGRRADAETITVTRNEILTALNAPDRFILAIVLVGAQRDAPASPRYIRQPFGKEPDFNVTSVNYNSGELLAMSEEPG